VVSDIHLRTPVRPAVTAVSGDDQEPRRTIRDATEWCELLTALRAKWESLPAPPPRGPLLPEGMTDRQWLDLEI
jgi:hypothetical protein